VETALKYGWPRSSIKIVEQDLGKSGSTTRNRQGWHEMFEAIAADKLGAIIVVDISRLSRDLSDFEKLRVWASYHDVLLIVDGRVVDPKDPTDTFMSQMSASFAMMENRQRAHKMTTARLASARRGKIVSQLPVGWIKKSDGSYGHDPEVAATVRHAIETVKRLGSLRQATRALIAEGVKLPAKVAGRLVWKQPNLHRLRTFIINSSYCGTYVYHKTVSAPEPNAFENGNAPRRNLPEKEWVVHPNILEPYITVEELQEIRSKLRGNMFIHSGQPRSGPALLTGLLVCPCCNKKLRVNYRGKEGHYVYICNYKYLNYGEKNPCMRIEGAELDHIIQELLFTVLESPPIEALEESLAKITAAEQVRVNQVSAERERLEHQLRLAQDRWENSHPEYELVFKFAEAEMNKALEELQAFERRASRVEPKKNEISAADLKTICVVVSEIPQLWNLATNEERKDVLRLAVEKIAVQATRELVEATIHWSGGQPHSFKMYKRRGRYNLIRELHVQGHSATEIMERLAAGKTSTGQKWKITESMVYSMLRKLRLDAHRFSSAYRSARQTAFELYDRYQDLERTAAELNKLGLRTLFDEDWTPKILRRVLKPQNQKKVYFENEARKACMDIGPNAPSDQDLSDELNRRGVQRYNRQPWNARAANRLRYRTRRDGIHE
jgi:DNA invertase Pin-like site-specific DNA recombinase